MLSAGGTGGHLFPAQALGAELSRRGWKLILMTDPRGHNYAQAFPSAEIVTVPSATFAGRSLFGKAAALFTLGRGMLSASAQLGRIAPAAVVGFGGYPSLPTLYAASRRDLPTLVHEQNAILGRVNRYLAPRVSIIAASFEGMERVPSSAQGKVVVTGNPVRETILALTELAYLPPNAGDRLTVLVFGGSQGARVLSQIVPKAVGQLPEALRGRLRIEQQCRPEDLNAVRAAYEQSGVT
ncbi:MAG TPA: UDP-N-acetylglucosamine--N-acetylmuramyl-(pentapeptide) pyrophosphoryl-undecaprenol N-acetylglucosamine transferase, partial [Alphaproteobacteria bacterium]|nr:UDP-N-acetylglucosamine--N-acetylmuramyl-(pentapeptide) pyrophosphoryl-undecaprenol N-acetylglucosamine transferase [Alphaproteobacteria bacterium]